METINNTRVLVLAKKQNIDINNPLLSSHNIVNEKYKVQH